jgi:hypothetical protein
MKRPDTDEELKKFDEFLATMGKRTGVKRVYMPHAGHFIGGDSCSFHLSTYVATGYIVSTVGEYRPSAIVEGEYPSQTIRARRDADPPRGLGYPEETSLYETMVFGAKKVNNACCPWKMVSGSELDSKRYGTPEEAAKGHEAFCRRWEKKRKAR